VAGRVGLPDEPTAVMLNVTVTAPVDHGFVTVYPCGETRPQASNLNATTGQVVNNLALAKVGTNGQICLYSLADTDLIVDVAGFVPAGGGLLPLVPARLLETRSGPNDATIDGAHEGDGQIVGGQFERVVIAGRGGVPDDATGAMLNTTAIAPADYGFMTLYPCDAERPNASNVNHGPGDVVANAVFVKLDPSGAVCVYSHSTSHVAIDVVGYTRDG